MYASSRRKLERAARRRALGGVDPRHEPLRGGLLVARRAVDLPGEEQPFDPLGLEPPRELGRLDEVVLHGVARTQQHRIFEARQRVHELQPARRAAGSSRSR